MNLIDQAAARINMVQFTAIGTSQRLNGAAGVTG
jgi:hypothetical protein